jgi:hypothetical protein
MKDFTLALERNLTTAIGARSRRRRRFLLAVPALAAAAAVAFAALPGSPPTAADILRTASAAAAEQRGLVGFGGVRYVRIDYRADRDLMRSVCRRCDPEVIGHAVVEQTSEQWVGADWTGRVVWGAPRRLAGSGDDAGWRSLANPPGEDELRAGGQTVHRTPLEQLPADPGQLRAALEPEGASREARIWELMLGANAILGASNAPADLRAAAYDMLARMEGATALGERRDRRGRTGQAIQITDTGERRFTFVIDPGSGTLLETVADYGQGPDTTATYDASARVAAVGERP